MPESEVRGITETPDGDLWIAMFNGLACFDGVHLTSFPTKRPPGCFPDNWKFCKGEVETCGRQRRSWRAATTMAVRRHGRQIRRAGAHRKWNYLRRHWRPMVLAGGRIIRWDEPSNHFIDVVLQSPNIRYDSLSWNSAGSGLGQNENILLYPGAIPRFHGAEANLER